MIIVICLLEIVAIMVGVLFIEHMILRIARSTKLSAYEELKLFKANIKYEYHQAFKDVHLVSSLEFSTGRRVSVCGRELRGRNKSSIRVELTTCHRCLQAREDAIRYSSLLNKTFNDFGKAIGKAL